MQFTLFPDRLCYEDTPGIRAEVQYLPLDRVPVRAMPRGYKPAIGVSMIDDGCARPACVVRQCDGRREVGTVQL